MFALRMLIALGEEIWICQFPIKVPKLEDENWEILGVISHGGNRLETEPLRFSLILLERPVCGARISRGSPMLGLDKWDQMSYVAGMSVSLN